MCNRVKKELARVFAAIVCMSAFSVYAGDVQVIAPVSASSSTDYGSNYDAQYMIDGSGLTTTGTIWEAVHTNQNAHYLFWHSDTPIRVGEQWVEFDLGAVYHVTNALIWQFAQTNFTSRGIQTFDIRVADEDHIFSVISTDNLLDQATGDPQEPLQVVQMVVKNIRYIRFMVNSNWGASGIVGLSEVRFEVETPDPLPTNFILMPLSASASTYYGDGTRYGPQFMADGSGLTGIGQSMTHTNANGPELFWHSDGSSINGHWVEFDLGATYNITNALIWQLAQKNLTTRGVKDYSIDVAGSDHVFSSYATGRTLNQATGDANEPVQVVSLVADEVRYVRLNIQSNYGASYVGLSEVAFEVALPEANPDDVLLKPYAVSVSSFHADNYGPQWMIDGSGLTGSGRSASHTDANAWELFWHSEEGTVVADQWVEFDLGVPCKVTNMLIWQLAQNRFTERGLKEFTIKVAGSDRVFSTYSTGNMLNKSAGQPEQIARVMPLAADDIRYVKLEVQSNWGSSQNIVGLSEVCFEVVPPETNAFIRIPLTNSVSTYYEENPAISLIDGSGLVGEGIAATHENGLGQGSMWLSDDSAVSNQWVELDLGGELNLVSAAIWQYNQTATHEGAGADFTGRGIREMVIYTAGNDKSYTEYGGVQLKQSSGFATEPAQLVNLTADRVRYVKFAISSNWGYDEHVGLGEVRFLYKRGGLLILVQ